MKFSKFVAASAVFAIAFVAMALWVSAGNSIAIDNSINSLMESMQNPFSTAIALFLDIVFDTIPVLLITAALSVRIWNLKKKKEALLLILSMALIALLVLGTKDIIHSARPANGIVNGNGFAFPSGHTAGSVVLLGTLLYIGWKGIPAKMRMTFAGFCLFSVMAVGFSRVYLNIHWLSDAIGGYLIGAACLGFVIFVYEKISSKRYKIRPLTKIINLFYKN